MIYKVFPNLNVKKFLENHGLLLRNEIYPEEPNKPLYREVSKQLCVLNIIFFPEFKNYYLIECLIVVQTILIKQYNIYELFIDLSKKICCF